MIYAMNFDENGNGDSGFEYPDGTTLPTGQVACTFEQYQNPSQWTLVNGSLVQSLTYAKAAQSALIKQGYLAALNTPVTFTNAAGVTSTYAFGNTLTAGGSNAQQLLASIVAAGSAAWKAGVWFDTNGVAQIMTFADLQNLAEAVEAQETPDEQDLMSLLAQIAAATTVSAVQAIVW